MGGILATRVCDKVKQKNKNGCVLTIERQKLNLAQNPQMFRYGILKEGIEKAVKRNLHITDESEAVEHLGYPIRIIDGSSSNIKITTQKDIDVANYFLKQLRILKPVLARTLIDSKKRMESRYCVLVLNLRIHLD